VQINVVQIFPDRKAESRVDQRMTWSVTANDVLHVVEHRMLGLEQTVDEDQQSIIPNSRRNVKQDTELIASMYMLMHDMLLALRTPLKSRRDVPLLTKINHI
jgi:hypothetical protein